MHGKPVSFTGLIGITFSQGVTLRLAVAPVPVLSIRASTWIYSAKSTSKSIAYLKPSTLVSLDKVAKVYAAELPEPALTWVPSAAPALVPLSMVRWNVRFYVPPSVSSTLLTERPPEEADFAVPNIKQNVRAPANPASYRMSPNYRQKPLCVPPVATERTVRLSPAFQTYIRNKYGFNSTTGEVNIPTEAAWANYDNFIYNNGWNMDFDTRTGCATLFDVSLGATPSSGGTSLLGVVGDLFTGLFSGIGGLFSVKSGRYYATPAAAAAADELDADLLEVTEAIEQEGYTPLATDPDTGLAEYPGMDALAEPNEDGVLGTLENEATAFDPNVEVLPDTAYVTAGVLADPDANHGDESNPISEAIARLTNLVARNTRMTRNLELQQRALVEALPASYGAYTRETFFAMLDPMPGGTLYLSKDAFGQPFNIVFSLAASAQSVQFYLFAQPADTSAVISAQKGPLCALGPSVPATTGGVLPAGTALMPAASKKAFGSWPPPAGTYFAYAYLEDAFTPNSSAAAFKMPYALLGEVTFADREDLVPGNALALDTSAVGGADGVVSLAVNDIYEAAYALDVITPDAEILGTVYCHPGTSTS